MANYKDSIVRHAKEINRLHGAIHENFKHRARSHSDREKWKKACAEYHSYKSSIGDWIENIRKADICDWQDAREFTLQYLTVDPVYNNSGYAKQILIKKIKACEFTKDEAHMLRRLIIRRIQSGGQGHLKQVCRLIPRLEEQAFNQEVKILANAKDKDVSLRGTIASQYLS